MNPSDGYLDRIEIESLPGMSLRDWFAGLAITGLADCLWGFERTAGDAYRLADALLTERAKKGEVK